MQPLFTGKVASLLDTTEPVLNDLIRRGQLGPQEIVGGRRHWALKSVVDAGRLLGRDEDQTKNRLRAHITGWRAIR